MSNCPYCGAEGGGQASCGSCQHHLPGSSVNSGRAQEPSGGGSGGGGGCFPKGTKILSPVGLKDISEIQKDDLVFSYVNDCLVSSRVLKVETHSKRKIWEIKFEDGSYIHTTSIHSFRANGKWVKASQLKIGSTISHFDSVGNIQFKTVNKSFETESVADVFNIVVKDNYNYIAEGAFVHSFTHFRKIRSFYWKIVTMFIDIDKCLPKVKVA